MRAACTAFCGDLQNAACELAEMRTGVKAWVTKHGAAGVLYFADATRRQTDFSLREPGRPKQGVASQEVTLLPRHWEWLQLQPNGASAASRRRVDEARNSPAGRSFDGDGWKFAGV